MLHTPLWTLTLEESNVDAKLQRASDMSNGCKNGHPAIISPLIKKQCRITVSTLLANCSLVRLKHTLAVDFGEVGAALRQATGNGGVLL